MATPVSIIDFPQEEFIMYRPSIMAICKDADNSVCAALILSKFIFWASSKRDVPIYKKMEELVTDLSNGFSRPTVMKQVAWLCEVGFMSRSKNSNPAYKYDKTFRYTVNAPAIQFAIDNSSQKFDTTAPHQVKSLTQENPSQVKELTQESESQVKNFTQDDSSQVKSLTDQSQKFDLKSASQVKSLTQEGGSQVKSLTSNTIEIKDKKEKKKEKDTAPEGTGDFLGDGDGAKEQSVMEVEASPVADNALVDRGAMLAGKPDNFGSYFGKMVAYCFESAPTAMHGSIMTQLLGTAKQGARKAYKLPRPARTRELLAFWLWWRNRTGQESLPYSAEKLSIYFAEFRNDFEYDRYCGDAIKLWDNFLIEIGELQVEVDEWDTPPPPEEQQQDPAITALLAKAKAGQQLTPQEQDLHEYIGRQMALERAAR